MPRKRPKPKERQTRIEANRKERKGRKQQATQFRREWNKGNRGTVNE